MGITWRLAGSLTIWLTLLAPPLALIAWLLDARALPLVLGSLLIAPIVFAGLMRALRGNRTRAKHRWMFAFGLGALLMPLSVLAAPFTLLLPSPAVGLVVLAIWIALTLHAQRRATTIHDVSIDVTVPGLDTPLRFVQLSDVHIGSNHHDSLTRIVAQALAHKPAFIVITGDLIDESRIGRDDLTALSRIDCPVYLCIGNHERYIDLDAAIDAITHQGVHVLRDSTTRHGPLRLIGIDDRDHPDDLPGILASLDDSDDAIDILLYHRPDGWAAACAAGIPLTLAGHTHGGQIWPFGHLVKRQYPEMIGRFERDGKTLYVSSGTGTWGPRLRLGTRSEMTVITLIEQAAEPPPDRQYVST